MGFTNQPARIVSYILMAVGTALLALNIYMDGKLNVALPLVFLVLGGVLLIIALSMQERSKWISLLYIPTGLLLAFGLVFLLNILTQDWSSWAYAWLLLVTGLGIGTALTARYLPEWPPLVQPIAWGSALAGLIFFAVFGAIAGGLFIQVMAPILLILGGLLLRWLRVDLLLPEPLLRRLRLAPQSGPASYPAPLAKSSEKSELVEPLSARELEVLVLVDQGLSNQQIAAKLSVAPSTVKTHINNAYGKLSVENRIQAVKRARELGLLQ